MRLPARIALAVSLTLASIASASTIRSQRVVTPSAPGPNVLIPDVELLSRARPLTYAEWTAGKRDLTTWSGGLEDLRLYDASGREVAYLLVPPPAERASWSGGRILSVASTKMTSGFEVDLGFAANVDRIRFGGIAAPFLKRFRLEGSGDRAHWTLLVDEGTLFDLPDENLERTEASFEAGTYRYFRVTWDDRSSARAGNPARAAARTLPIESRTKPVLLPLSFERLPSEPRHSRFRVRLPGRNVPVISLQLAIDRGNVMRHARVTEARYGNGQVLPVEIGSLMLRRAERGDIAATDLTIPIERPSGTQLEIDVDDGNNPPLPLAGVFGELAPVPTIYFESGDGAPLQARFGDPRLAAPNYDLEATRRFITKTAAARASWGAFERPAAIAQAREQNVAAMLGGPIGKTEFAYKRTIPPSKAGLVTLPIDASVLAHARTDLADIRIADADGRQIPYLVETREQPLILDLPPAKRDASETRRGFTAYEIRMPYDRLPGATLVLETSNRVFERTVTLDRPAADRKTDREAISQTAWAHADPENDPPALSIGLPETRIGSLRIVVDEGDNAPLAIMRMRLLLPSRALRFYHPGAQLTLLYGDAHVDAPRYDLALLSTRLFGADSTEMAAADESPTNAARSDTTRAIFWGVLVVAVVALLAILGRLLKGEQAT